MAGDTPVVSLVNTSKVVDEGGGRNIVMYSSSTVYSTRVLQAPGDYGYLLRRGSTLYLYRAQFSTKNQILKVRLSGISSFFGQLVSGMDSFIGIMNVLEYTSLGVLPGGFLLLSPDLLLDLGLLVELVEVVHDNRDGQ